MHSSKSLERKQMSNRVITFSPAARNEILDAFGVCVDAEGYITEKTNPAARVLTPDGDFIKADKFAGLKKGSLQFLRSDLPSLIELSDSLKE